MKLALALVTVTLASAQSWIPQTSGTTASFRGIHPVDAQIIWVSGTGGTYVTTTDGGATWHAAQVAGAEKLDFRAVWAFDSNTAYLLSIGTGDQSRIYGTNDGGAHWKLLFTNPDAKGFFDGIAFWDRSHGIVAGDPVEGRTTIFTTDDAGETWQRQSSPEAIGTEGAFAASNTSLALFSAHEVWLGTTAARVLHSPDNGRTWTAVATSIRHDGSGAGVFSVAFRDALHGIAGGGDYTKPAESRDNLAITTDGGKTWSAPSGTPPAGFRSAVAWLPGTKTWIATGTSGSDVSTDDGASWKQFDSTGYNAASFVSTPLDGPWDRADASPGGAPLAPASARLSSNAETGMNAILVFVATAYALSIALGLVVGLTGGHDSALIGLGYLSMFLPAISVLIVNVAMNEPPRLRWERFPLKYLPVALFLIPVVQHAVMLPFVAHARGGMPWQDWLTPQADGLYHTPASHGWGALTIQGVVAHVAFNAVVGLAVVSVLAFFEEVGWRAWLLPRLVDRIGARRAVVVSSLIWALWHVPFQLSGIQHIDGVSPRTLALTMPLGIMAVGLILGWLWLRTGSIWMVAIAHGASNNWGQYAFKFMKDSITPDAVSSDLAALRLGSVALLFAGVFLLWFGIPSERLAEQSP